MAAMKDGGAPLRQTPARHAPSHIPASLPQLRPRVDRWHSVFYAARSRVPTVTPYAHRSTLFRQHLGPSCSQCRIVSSSSRVMQRETNRLFA